MSMIMLTVWVTVLVIANLFMFFVLYHFSKSKKDTASKIGFGFMKLLALSNIITVWGLLIWGL